MKIDRNGFVPQCLWVGNGRVRPDENSLTGDGGPQLDDSAPDFTHLGAMDLTPLTGVERGSSSFFKRRMPPEGVDLPWVGLRRPRRVPLPRPQKLYLDVLLGKESFLVGHKPRQIENGLTEFIRHLLHTRTSSCPL